MASIAKKAGARSAAGIRPRSFEPVSSGPVSFVPQDITADERLRDWLLPAERPEGMEAVIQTMSKGAGIVVLLTAAGALAFFIF